MAFARISLPAVVLMVLLGTGGCGGAADATRSSGANEWAKAVCVALNPWREQIAELTRQAQQQMAGATTPEQTRTSLVALLAGAERSSETARTKVADAGVPPVDGGQRIADRFTTSLAKARDAYGRARATVDKLPTADGKRFYDGVATAFAKLGEEYAASAIDTSDIGSADLQRAFDDEPECE